MTSDDRLVHSPTEPVWVRRLALICLAVELTFVLGAMTEMDDFIGPACIPVGAGCLALERYSRGVPAVTPAHTQRQR
jgi:hypothetical protein